MKQELILSDMMISRFVVMLSILSFTTSEKLFDGLESGTSFNIALIILICFLSFPLCFPSPSLAVLYFFPQSPFILRGPIYLPSSSAVLSPHSPLSYLSFFLIGRLLRCLFITFNTCGWCLNKFSINP